MWQARSSLMIHYPWQYQLKIRAIPTFQGTGHTKLYSRKMRICLLARCLTSSALLGIAKSCTRLGKYRIWESRIPNVQTLGGQECDRYQKVTCKVRDMNISRTMLTCHLWNSSIPVTICVDKYQIYHSACDFGNISTTYHFWRLTHDFITQ